MKSWLVVFGVVVLILVPIGGSALLLRSGQLVQTERVTQTTVRQYVDERGKTRLPEIHRITMPFAGRIESIPLRAGTPVKAGQPVARIVAADLQLAVDEARAIVKRYASAIDENRDLGVENRLREQAQQLVASMAKTAEAAEARLTSSERRLEFAARFRRDLEQLFQENAVSKTEFEQAQVDEVDRQVEYAQAALIWQATESMRKATDILPRIIDAYVDRKEKTRLVLEGQLAEATAGLQVALLQQRRGEMRSPVDGVILARQVTNERFLAAGTELLTIGQMDRLEVEADVLSVDVGRIRKGDPVEIYGFGEGEQLRVPGTVSRIYPAGFTKVSSLGVEEQRVKVVVSFDEGHLQTLLRKRNLGVDFRVRIRIITDQADQTLAIARSALFRGADGNWEVFAIRGGRARRQVVDVGLMNDRQVEVLQGLTKSDVVVVAPESSLRDGMKVRTNGEGA